MPGIEAPPLVYPSKRDAWLTVVLWVAAGAMLFAANDVWSSADPFVFRLGFGATMAAMAGFTIWILYSTSYMLAETELTARSGPFRWRVPLDAIDSVTTTRSPLSAPACSLDRLNVRYGGRRVGLMVSPADKEGFLRDLRLRCPHLIEDGPGLSRRGTSP